jgi:hypothetical protein
MYSESFSTQRHLDAARGYLGLAKEGILPNNTKWATGVAIKYQ